MIDLLILLLRPALLCVEGGSRRPHHVLAALLAYALDVLICVTYWKYLAGPRQPGEKTISDTLERLCGPGFERHQRRGLFVAIAQEINRASPTGRHIKVVLP